MCPVLCTQKRVKTVFCLFSKLDRWMKPSFIPLNPKQPHLMMRVKTGYKFDLNILVNSGGILVLRLKKDGNRQKMVANSNSQSKEDI